MAEGTSNAGNAAAEGTPSQETANNAQNAESNNEGKQPQQTDQANDVDNWFKTDKPEVEQENKETETDETKEETEEKPEVKEEKVLHKLFQKIAEKFKDQQFNEDSEYLDKTFDYLEGLEGEKTQRDAFDQKLINAFNQYPNLKEAMINILSGLPDRVALAKVYKPEDFNPVEGDEQMEELKKAHEERLKKQTEAENRNKQLGENQKKSIETVTKFITDNKLDENTTSTLIKQLDADMLNIRNDVLTPEFLAYYYSAFTKEKDIEDAVKQATVKTNNQKIVDNKKKQAETDGLPKIDQTKQVSKNKPEELSETMKDLEAINNRYEKIHTH